MRLSFGNKPLWVQICRWLWKPLQWLWTFIVFGAAINILSIWLTSKQFNLTGTPMGWLLDYLYVTVTLVVVLIVITVIIGLVTILNDPLPPPSLLVSWEENRDGFIKQLHYDYKELLAQFLPNNMPPISLSWQSQPDAVRNKKPLRPQIPGQSESTLSTSTSILQVYERADGKLLILGEPGAGKTTLLLRLAWELLNEAEINPKKPLPVIVNLSTWANTGSSLQDWLIEDVASTYNVPHALAAHGIEHNHLLPLLDGLDEVPDAMRSACIEAINTYKKNHLGSLVVCCRAKEYASLSSQLKLRAAVFVQPLQEQQIEDYFQSQEIEEYYRTSGGSLSSIKEAYQSLKNLVKTPLMLHMLMLTYNNSPRIVALSEQKSIQYDQKHLLEYYVNNRLEIYKNKFLIDSTEEKDISRDQQERERTNKNVDEKLKQVRHQLTWLAQQMGRHNLKIFHIEQMQPDWLPATQAYKYEWFAVRWPGILIGILLSLLVNALIPNSFDPVRLIIYGFIGGHIGNLFSSAQIGMQVGRRMKLIRSIALSLGTSTLIGLGVWLCIWFTVGQTYTVNDVLHNGGITGLSSAVSSFLLYTCCMFFYKAHKRTKSFSSPITGFMHADGASWRRWIGNGILIGSCIGLTFGIITWFFFLEDGADYAAIFGIRDGMTYGLTFALIGALLSIIFGRINREIHPTEILNWSLASLWRSLWSRRHLTLTCFVGLSLAVVFGAASSLSTFSGEWLSQHNLVAEIKPSLILSIGLGDGLTYGLTFGIAYWLLLGLYRGLSSDYLPPDDRSEPNEGIRRSLDNSMRIGLYGGLIIGLIGILSTTLYFGLHAGFGQGFTVGLIQGWYTGLNNVLNVFSSGLIVGLQLVLFGGSLACVLVGGLACFRHFVLRRLLWQSGKIPFNYPDFLDRAAKCILLRKAGGGYMFVHLEFQDYMASLVECSSCGHVDDRRNRRFCSSCGKPIDNNV